MKYDLSDHNILELISFKDYMVQKYTHLSKNKDEDRFEIVVLDEEDNVKELIKTKDLIEAEKIFNILVGRGRSKNEN